MEPKKLFLLDALALIYRAYFAFSKNPRINSKNVNTSAMFGFTNTLLDVLNNENPTHIAVAFDTSAPTARHIDFENYKAHRQEMPEDLRTSIPIIKNIIRAFNIPVIELDGYEADDIIGTLAKRAEAENFEVFMMTPDKDYGQLVTDKIKMYKPAVFGNPPEVVGIEGILKKFDITSIPQVIDILGLMGDAADNIPGIPGVGEKTAAKLLHEYGTLENVLQNAHNVKGKLGEKIRDHADQAILSKQLATIILDVPVAFDEASLLRQQPNEETLREIFNELEFKQLTKRVFAQSVTESPASKTTVSTVQSDLFDTDIAEPVVSKASVQLATLNDVPHQYFLCNDAQAYQTLVQNLLQQSEFCFDTETTGIDANAAELVGMSFSYKKGEAYYIPFTDDYAQTVETLKIFKPVFENESIAKVGQNLKYDIIMLRWYEIQVQGPLFDTMLAHYLIEPDQKHNMDFLAALYLNYEPIAIETLIGEKRAGQLSMRTVALEQIMPYACEDADVTLQLKQILHPLLERNKVFKLFAEVEVPLMRVLVNMETEGVRINPDFLNQLSTDLQKDITVIESNIYQSCGTTFNIASPRQLGEILFDHLKIDTAAKKTRTGQYATGEDVLSKLEHVHPVVKMVLDFRELVKLKNTYVDTLPQMINKRTGRIHTNFMQTVAATGRLSSNNPNLQNIPIRTNRGKEIRKAFISRNNNFTLLSADYSQIELRIIAHFSNDASMIEAFKNKIDIHAATASKVYGVALADVDATMRRNAKMVNFGIIYGISAFGLSQRLNIPRKEAAEIIENYFMQYPTIKSYMDNSIQMARAKGYVETILGRKRFLRDINSANATVRGFAERNAINAPIQGSAADLIKLAMIDIDAEIANQNLRTRMTLQVHDELVFDVPLDEIDLVKPIIKQKMENAMQLHVPVDVEIGMGNNWLEAH